MQTARFKMAMHLLGLVGFLMMSALHASSCEVVRYDWRVTELNTTSFDGVQIEAIGINDEPCHMHPIEVTLGDEVEVHLTNELSEQTCMHWHGLRQFGTQEMDGVSGITQCQVQPGDTAIYRFKPDKCGSFWYHGHETTQYAFGLRGPLIVHCPPGQQQSWEQDVYEEITVMLGDWYHDLPTGAPIWDTVLINNQGQYNCTVARAAGKECVDTQPLPHFQFVPGKKYLLRLLNVCAMAAFDFSIDGHTFQVVGADGDYLEPSTPVNTITINVAQRYDILVQAKNAAEQGQFSYKQSSARVDSFWMRATSLFGIPWTAREADQVPEGFNPEALAIIDYEENPVADPTSQAWTSVVAINEFEFASVTPVVLPDVPDRRVVLEFTLAVLPANPNAFLGYISADEGNFSSLVIPDDPPLLTIAKGASTEELPESANAVKLEYGDHVEVVLVNETPDQHPFHLHAHSSWVVASGHNSREAILANDIGSLKLNDPMLHDVYTVPGCNIDDSGACIDFGYVVLRMNADNPGVWLMHCHIDWHFVLGLAMLFIEAEDILHQQGLGAFSSNMLNVCNGAGNFTI